MDNVIDVNDFSIEGNTPIRIVVDTNVLLWWFYGKVTFVEKDGYKDSKDAYQKFLKLVAKNKQVLKLYTSAVNICEAYHVIEKTELDIYNNRIVGTQLKLKDFRNSEANRKIIHEEIKQFYQNLSKLIDICDYNFSKPLINCYRKNYIELHYDAFDNALLDFCIKNQADFLLTDDIDFICVQDKIKLLTANKKALS